MITKNFSARDLVLILDAQEAKVRKLFKLTDEESKKLKNSISGLRKQLCQKFRKTPLTIEGDNWPLLLVINRQWLNVGKKLIINGDCLKNPIAIMDNPFETGYSNADNFSLIFNIQINPEKKEKEKRFISIDEALALLREDPEVFPPSKYLAACNELFPGGLMQTFCHENGKIKSIPYNDSYISNNKTNFFCPTYSSIIVNAVKNNQTSFFQPPPNISHKKG